MRSEGRNPEVTSWREPYRRMPSRFTGRRVKGQAIHRDAFAGGSPPANAHGVPPRARGRRSGQRLRRCRGSCHGVRRCTTGTRRSREVDPGTEVTEGGSVFAVTWKPQWEPGSTLLRSLVMCTHFSGPRPFPHGRGVGFDSFPFAAAASPAANSLSNGWFSWSVGDGRRAR